MHGGFRYTKGIPVAIGVGVTFSLKGRGSVCVAVALPIGGGCAKLE